MILISLGLRSNPLNLKINSTLNAARSEKEPSKSQLIS